MIPIPCRAHPLRVALGGAVALSALLVAAPAGAQYKVVGPDGKVTYTDRAPAPSEGRVTAINGRSTPAAAGDAGLPFELRQVASRYPVVLYVSQGACEPCDSGRSLLRQRGVPYSERVVASVEDAEALEKLSGSREAPTLMIGAQVVRGMATDLWNSYLDAAGYPRESKLPPNYQYRPATPVVDRPPVASARPAGPPPPAAPPALPPVMPGSIRF